MLIFAFGLALLTAVVLLSARQQLKDLKSFASDPIKLTVRNCIKQARPKGHINTFDIDGVIFVSKEVAGVYPGPDDVIITGRCVEEMGETFRMLDDRGILNKVYFQECKFEEKTRASSGQHKANVLNRLLAEGWKIGFHIDDDEVQIAEINKLCPTVPVIHAQHNLTNKENVRHLDF
jgi:hypothetical protein